MWEGWKEGTDWVTYLTEPAMVLIFHLKLDLRTSRSSPPPPPANPTPHP